MEEENLTPEQIKEKAMENIQKMAKETATEVANEVLKGINEKMESLSTKEEIEKALEDAKKELDKKHQVFIAEQKKQSQIVEREGVTFSSHFKSVIEENREVIKSYRNGRMVLTTKGDTPATIDLGSFAGHSAFTQRPQEGVIMTPFNRVWISDVLTPVNSDGGASIIYPKEDTPVGAMDLHTPGTAKEQLQYKLTTASAHFKTVAGYVIVDKATLEDVSFLMSYIQTKLYNDLRNKENAIILAGTADSSPLEGIYADATSYDGNFTDPIGKIVDALYGKIAGDTSDNYVGNTLFLHPRDVPTIGLQVASGSGEYSLPAGIVSFVNGKLNIGGANVVQTSSIQQGKFLAIDNSAVAFVRRLAPELVISDQGYALMKENEVMLRIEERFAHLIFNKNALVKGSL